MAEARHVSTKWRTFRAEPDREDALVDIAERQHGVVDLGQLRGLGLSASAVRSRERRRRLHRVHRGVYAVGRPGLTERGRWIAAVLAYGPDGVLSHRDAAGLHGIRRDQRASIDVTVPRRARGRRHVTVHVSRTLTPEDIAERDGIRCTSVARTLVDLGDVVPRRAVERAVEQAEVLRVFDASAVAEVLDGAGPRRGAGVLRRVLGEREGEGLTASELEERFLAICRTAALPQPDVNAWLLTTDRAAKADFLWRPERLVVETDGRSTHGTRQAFESDRERDQRLAVAGYRVVRFSWRQVVRRPEHVASTVASLLGR